MNIDAQPQHRAIVTKRIISNGVQYAKVINNNMNNIKLKRSQWKIFNWKLQPAPANVRNYGAPSYR